MRDLRPARADLADDPGDFLHRPGAAVDVGGPQLGRQQMTAAEDVERQIAVAVVIAVEEPAFLMAVQRIVGGVEIEDDLLRRRRVGFQKKVDEQRLDRRRLVADLVIAGGDRLGEFQPIERRLAGQRRAVLAPRRELARQHRHQRIMAKIVMVVEVFVAERDAEHPLSDERAHAVLDAVPASASRQSRRRTARPGRSRDRSIPEASRPHPR